MNWTGLAIIIIAAAAALAVAVYLVRWIRRIGRSAEGLIDQVKLAQVREETTPKSLAAMDSLLLPQILKDFPEYNPSVIIDRVKADAKLYYESAKEGRILFEQGISTALRESMSLPEGVAGGIVVHRAALTGYDTRGRDRLITYQAAVKYDDDRGTPHQKRLTLRYIAASTDDFANEIEMIKCPNCGAPVPTVGEKVCRYCGTALVTSAGLGWVLTSVKEG
ncbi:MAG: zinc ribbon domain-containing protein [Clostridia bacterium]|jgi:hypothetical protein|nr:zinc ribbon domain-containing protein [Clostridia bacterium]